MTTVHYVFGYGSLVAPARTALDRTVRDEGFVADVHGVIRVWGVAMDNRDDLPGYKYYTDPGGRRPSVYVAFLDLRPAPDGCSASVNGLCLPIDEAGLDLVDRRERNYDRIDVTDRLTTDVGGARVWAYSGSAAGRARLAHGRANGTAVVQRAYLDAVRAAFAALGDDELRRCEPSLDLCGLPVIDLTRHELA